MSSKNMQLCRFCQRHVKLAYYCEECGVSCCSDCLHDERVDYFICQDCNSKNIEFFDSNGKKICKDCGSENVHKASQHLKSCPKCHSHKILNIYEKKEELEQKFLDIIKETRCFIQPLRDVINELYILRHKVQCARSPPIQCYHYPKMESELLVLFKQVIHIKENLLEKINTHFRHLALNKAFFFDIYNQPNSNIRIIESMLDNLCRSHDSIKKYIDENNKEIYEKFEDFQKNLSFIEKIKKLFLPYKRFLNLAEHEKPVYAVRTTLTNGMDNQHKFIKKNKGILFLTNYDLSFVHEYGFIKKKREVIFKAPINDLINIYDKGKLFKKLCIQFDYGKYEFSFPSNLLTKVIDYIVLARSFQDNDIYNQEIAENLQEIDINLNDLIRYIEEGINSFFSSKIIYNTKMNKKQKKELEQPKDKRLIPPYYYDVQNEPKVPYYNSPIPPTTHPPKPHYPFTHNLNPKYPYYQPLRTAIPNEFAGSNFYPQKNYQDNRFQNYQPHEDAAYNYHQQYQGAYPYDKPFDYDERNILMKRLGKLHQDNCEIPPFSSQSNEDFYNECGVPSFTESSFRNGYNNSVYNDFQKNHLSKFFNANDPSLRHPNNRKYDFDELKEAKKMISELKRERYSLKKTLKELETKFEGGVITDVDYFRTYKKLQKDVYSIEKKIRTLKDKIEDELFLRRNYNKKTFTV
jgi:hypothetical protein